MQAPYKVALGVCVATTYGFHTAMQSRISRPKTTDPGNPSDSLGQKQAQRQMASIRTLLEDVKTRTTREKLEAAYDAATQTHEIGFPNFPAGARDDKERGSDSS